MAAMMFYSYKYRTGTNTERLRKLSGRSVRLPSFTIFESTVAVTIISIVLGLSTMIYANVLDSENPVVYYQAKQEIDKLLINTKKERTFFNKTFDYETYEIQQEVDFYKGNKKLYQVNYKVLSANKELWTESHLIANDEEK